MTTGPDIRCGDCGTPLLLGGREPACQWFMVHEKVWTETSLPATGGHYLCLADLERRIGRPLTPDDLTDEYPINEPRGFDLPRLRALKVAAAQRRGERA
jgi:hypothetical protein